MNELNIENLGWIYVLSNPSFPLLFKIGMILSLNKTPDERASELYTTGVPTPFKVEFAKCVNNPREKEKNIHNILTMLELHPNPSREFFRVPLEVVRGLFELIDGKMYNEPETFDLDAKKCRDVSKCFYEGQRIRHCIGDDNKTWIGIYSEETNSIIHNDISYSGRSPLNKFATAHYEYERPHRTSCNAWAECECEVKGKWISTFNLSEKE